MNDEATAPDPFVRPYVITAGRTVGAGGEIPIETMVIARRNAAGLSEDHGAVLGICSTPTSVAEVTAHRSVPVGVARVLVADMTESGHLEMFETAAVEDTAIVRRLLDGIRSL